MVLYDDFVSFSDDSGGITFEGLLLEISALRGKLRVDPMTTSEGANLRERELRLINWTYIVVVF